MALLRGMDATANCVHVSSKWVWSAHSAVGNLLLSAVMDGQLGWHIPW